MSEMERLEARLRALGAAPDNGTEWDDVLRRAGERFSAQRYTRRRLAVALVTAVALVASVCQ